MEIVLIYERRYFTHFKIDLEKKVKSQGQSVDFDQTWTLCKIRERKGKKKAYFRN